MMPEPPVEQLINAITTLRTDLLRRLEGTAEAVRAFEPRMVQIAHFILRARAEALDDAAVLSERVFTGEGQDPITAVMEYRELIRAAKEGRDG